MLDEAIIKRSFKLVAIAILAGMSGAIPADEKDPSDDRYRRILEKSILQKNGNVEVLVREHVYPPGWKAPTHYHDGDLFIYVVEGSFEVITEEEGQQSYGPGEAMQMAAQTIMDARNSSDSAPLKLVVFQIGEPGEPFLIPTE